MELKIRRFDELSAAEFERIARLRVDVFVVEQNCPYPELDGNDPQCMHIWMEDEEGIAAYCRVLPAGLTFDTPSIGRVISARRRKGHGTVIVNEGIRVAEEVYGAEIITIEAQTYARSLYEKCGFVQDSEEFLEDGIPHIRMIHKKSKISA